MADRTQQEWQDLLDKSFAPDEWFIADDAPEWQRFECRHVGPHNWQVGRVTRANVWVTVVQYADRCDAVDHAHFLNLGD